MAFQEPYVPHDWSKGDFITEQLLDTMEQGIEYACNNKMNKPTNSGVHGQVLTSYGDGTSRWQDLYQPSQEAINVGVETWLSSALSSSSGFDVYTMPELYGAIGDGSSNDSSAIQSAINSGRDVSFGPKTYYCGSRLEIINKSNLIIDGDGAILHMANNTSGIYISNCHNIIIKNLKIECTSTSNSTSACSCITVTGTSPGVTDVFGCSNITIENCILTGSTNNLTIYATKNLKILNCQINDTAVYASNETLYGGIGLSFNSCQDVQVEYCDFIMGNRSARDIESCKITNWTLQNENIKISNCTFDHGAIQTSYEEDNYPRVNTNLSIQFYDSKNIYITNCCFKNHIAGVLACSDTTDNIYFENNIIDGTQYREGDYTYLIRCQGNSANNLYPTVFISNLKISNIIETVYTGIYLNNCKAYINSCDMDIAHIYGTGQLNLQISNIITKGENKAIELNDGSASGYIMGVDRLRCNIRNNFDATNLKFYKEDKETFEEWKILALENTVIGTPNKTMQGIYYKKVNNIVYIMGQYLDIKDDVGAGTIRLMAKLPEGYQPTIRIPVKPIHPFFNNSCWISIRTNAEDFPANNGTIHFENSSNVTVRPQNIFFYTSFPTV